jgi:hypothetical protein
MNLKHAAVLMISAFMLLMVAGCCCPMPFWPSDMMSNDTSSTSKPSAPTKPAATTEPTEFTWGADLSAGMQQAASDGKPVLLDFWGGG